MRSSPLLTGTSNSHNRRRLRRRPLGRYRYVRLRWRVLFSAIDFLGRLLFSAGRALRRRILGRLSDPPVAAEDPKVVLLVQLDHLGDAIITAAMLPALRRRYPAASIEVLAGPWNREVFEALPEVDRVWVSRVNRFARGGLARFAWIAAVFWWGWMLRRRKIDLGIDVRGDFPVAVILWLSGARRRLGWGSAGGRFLLTAGPRYVPNRPEVDSRMALLAELGIRPEKGSGLFFARQGDAPPTDHRPKKSPDPFSVVLHVGAGTPAKRWPVGHWRELLGRIVVGCGAKVVLVGGRGDRIIARRILGGRPWPGVTDRTDRLSVMELAGLLRRAGVMVGADSGPAHLAAAVDTPVVVMFSGTNDPHQWRPRGRRVSVVRHPVECSPCHRRRCPLPDHPCMCRLSAERVFAEVQKIIDDSAADRLAVAGTAANDPQPV